MKRFETKAQVNSTTNHLPSHPSKITSPLFCFLHIYLPFFSNIIHCDGEHRMSTEVEEEVVGTCVSPLSSLISLDVLEYIIAPKRFEEIHESSKLQTTESHVKNTYKYKSPLREATASSFSIHIYISQTFFLVSIRSHECPRKKNKYITCSNSFSILKHKEQIFSFAQA